MQLRDNYRYVNITSSTTTQVTSNAGQLIKIIVNQATSTITLIDGTGSTPIATMKPSLAEGSYEFLCEFTQGLKVLKGTTGDITIVYSSIGN